MYFRCLPAVHACRARHPTSASAREVMIREQSPGIQFSSRLRFLQRKTRPGNAVLITDQAMTTWSRGVTVSTLDSESSDRGSNPRGTSLVLICTSMWMPHPSQRGDPPRGHTGAQHSHPGISLENSGTHHELDPRRLLANHHRARGNRCGATSAARV